MRPDNSHHLLAAARKRSDSARHRAIKALAEIRDADSPQTVSELARRAGVSRSWLYSQPDLLEQLHLAAHAPRTTPTGSAVRASDASLHRRLQLAHQRIQQLTEQNKRLRDQLARAHGSLRAASTN
jgi:small-conductance mechanosensitive channel